MPQRVTLYRMLVASPSDCVAERQLIPRIVADWNASHCLHTGNYVEPVLWETHAHAEMGDGPQPVINRQLVDNCDFAVAVFWSRLGTPTKMAASGAVEELQRLRAAGKPVLVYFSQAPIRPDLVDVDQLRALREYQREVASTGMIFTYTDIQDFDRLFGRQLATFMSSISVGPLSRREAREALVDALASAESASEGQGGLVRAVREVQRRTSFLWKELSELSPFQDYLTAEIKENTFNDVKSALEHLVSLGHLTYEVSPADRLTQDGSAVATIRMQHITAQLRNIAKYVAAHPDP